MSSLTAWKYWVFKDFKNSPLTSYREFCTVVQYLALVGVDKTRCFQTYWFCKLCNRDIFAFGCWCYKIFYDVGAEQYFLSGGDKSNCCYTKYCVFMLSKRDFLVFIIHRLLIKIPKQRYSSKVLSLSWSWTNSGVVYCKELLLEPIITSLSSLSLSLLSKLASSFSSSWSQQRGGGGRWVDGWEGEELAVPKYHDFSSLAILHTIYYTHTQDFNLSIDSANL